MTAPPIGGGGVPPGAPRNYVNTRGRTAFRPGSKAKLGTGLPNLADPRNQPPPPLPNMPDQPAMPPPPADFPGGGGVNPPRPPSEPPPQPPVGSEATGPWDFNPYVDSPDFANQTIHVNADPNLVTKDANGQPMNELELYAKLLNQIRTQGWGTAGSAQQISGMQNTLNNVRSMGGIHYGVTGSKGTAVGERASSPAQTAIDLRRRGMQGRTQTRGR